MEIINEILVLVLPKKTNNKIFKQKFLLIDGLTPTNLPLYIAFFQEKRKKICLQFMGRVKRGYIEEETQLTEIEFTDFFKIPKEIVLNNSNEDLVPKRKITFMDLFSNDLEKIFFIDKNVQKEADSKAVYFVNLTKEIIEELNLPPVIPLLEEDYNNFNSNEQGILQIDDILRGIKFVLDFDPGNKFIEEYRNFYIDSITEKALLMADSNKVTEALEMVYSELIADPANPTLHKLMGVVYMKKNNYDKAAESFEQALSYKKNDYESLKNLGVCFHALKKNDLALQNWEKAYKLKEGKKDIDLIVTMGKAFLGLENFKKSEKFFKVALKHNSANRFARSYLGVVYASTDHPKKAIKTWKTVLKGDIFEPYTMVNMARLSLIIKDFEKSFEYAFRVAFTASQIDADLRRMASQILNEAEKSLRSKYSEKDPIKYKSSREYIFFTMLEYGVRISGIKNIPKKRRKNITALLDKMRGHGLPIFFLNFIDDPQSPADFKYLPLVMGAEFLVFKNYDLFEELLQAEDLMEALGVKSLAEEKDPKTSLVEPEEPEDTEGELLDSVQENPDDPWVHYKLGVHFMDKKEFDKAIGFFDEVTRLSPENSMAYHAKGAALSKLGRYKDAANAFQRAIVSTPDDSLRSFFERMNYRENIAYFDLGDTYAKMDMLDDAIKMFKKGLESDVKIPLAHFQLGVCYASLKEHDKAVKSFENVLFLQPTFTPAYVRLGLSYMQLEDFEKAIKSLTFATRVNPMDQEALVALGQAYLMCNEIEMAIKCFNSAAVVGPETEVGRAAKEKAYELMEGKK